MAITKIPARSRTDWKNGLTSLQRSRRLALILNQAQRLVGAGNYWSWIDVPELQHGIDITSLVCPLRYDVLIRRDFFTFYVNHRDLYRFDPKAFVEETKRTTYYAWYVESEAVRTNQHLRGNASLLELNFVERIQRAVQLYESVQKQGFSARFPITIKTAKHVLPPTTDRGGPPTGKRIRAKYFLADGCHRLALLMAMGYQVLPPSYFCVKCFQEFSPFDSTSLLARRLIAQPSEYFAYLSSFYTAPIILKNRTDFLAQIQHSRPELLDEVLTVMRVDGFDHE